MARKRV